LIKEDRSLTEFSGVGPYLEKLIRGWIQNPPALPEPSEIREGFFTLPQAQAVLATSPAWASSLKGDLQTHTQWSDGSGSIAEMADAAASRGYEYIAITDHSKGLKIAGGIDENELQQQASEVATVNQNLKNAGHRIRVLHSIELNLDPQGKGDMEEDSLENLDLVLGCFHTALRRKEDQTDRYLAALRNPAIQILGHPRGRIYNFRLGLKADWPRVFALAAKLDKAVEIDAYPDRQDLSVDLVRLAKKSGCRISLGTDSHDPSQLRSIELGLASALIANVKPDRILNFLTRDELLTWVATVRGRRRAA
jgi:histidinol phosphatase-like PHP family hydrolase